MFSNDKRNINAETVLEIFNKIKQICKWNIFDELCIVYVCCYSQCSTFFFFLLLHLSFMQCKYSFFLINFIIKQYGFGMLHENN